MSKIIKKSLIIIVLFFVFLGNNFFAISTTESEFNKFYEVDVKYMLASEENKIDIEKPNDWFGNIWKPLPNDDDDESSQIREIAEFFKKLILGDFLNFLVKIGNLIFFAVGVGLGIKYLFSSVNGKSEVKNSLITYVVSVLVFYLATHIFTFFENIFNGFVDMGSVDKVIGAIWSTILNVGNIVAIVGLISVGLKYMLSPAEEKGKIKNDLKKVVIGLILIFCIPNILNFIFNIGNEIFKENNYEDYIENNKE